MKRSLDDPAPPHTKQLARIMRRGLAHAWRWGSGGGARLHVRRELVLVEAAEHAERRRAHKRVGVVEQAHDRLDVDGENGRLERGVNLLEAENERLGNHLAESTREVALSIVERRRRYRRDLENVLVVAKQLEGVVEHEV